MQKSDRPFYTHNASCSQRYIYILACAVMGATLLLPIILAPASAGMKKTFVPRISIRNQYDDNIALAYENENADWITTVSPGLTLRTESPGTQISLDYEAGFSSYRDDASRDSTSHQGIFRLERAVCHHLRIEMRDTFIRSEDPLLMTEEGIEEVFRERRIYHRNTGEATLSWQFSADGSMTIGYRNRYLDSKSPGMEDSISHEGFLDIDTWLTRRFGITLNSRVNHGAFKQPEGFAGTASEDFYQYEGGVALNYRWGPTHRLYARYSLLNQDFVAPHPGEGTDDFRVHQGVLGLNMPLTRWTGFNIEGGYIVQDSSADRTTDSGTFTLSLSTRRERASASISGSTGYDQDYLSSENLGSSKYRQADGRANYQLAEHLRIFGSASYRREEYFGRVDQEGRDDRIQRMEGGVSYALWRWLSFSLDSSHTERTSTDDTVEFRDTRIMLYLSAAYPISW